MEKNIKLKEKLLSAAGVAGPLVYVLAVVLGGALRPGYSHMGQAISELIEAGAPNQTLLDALFVFYNLLVGAFAFRLLLWKTPVGQRFQKIGAWMLAVTSFVGLLMPLFFPMDPRGAPATSAGTVHLVLAGVSSLGTMLSILFIGLWFKVQERLDGITLFSFLSLTIVFVSGLIAAVCVGKASPLMGLAERITIGAFLVWVFVLAIRTFFVKEEE